ncbi:MAG: SocA family protein [candidate division Zixibacteria bacterium]|nr:SocA family protein [candidate division Zixibacteria bacterium]
MNPNQNDGKLVFCPPKIPQSEHILLKELILYIANRLTLHPKFGATKLNKILFYSDFIAYAELGDSITGERYWRLPKGPAPRFLVQVRKQMLKADEIVCYSVNTLSGRQDRIAPKRPADLKKFIPEQISIVERVIEELKDKDAFEVSRLSHKFIGWKIVKERQDIPYETVFLRDPKDITVTEKDREIALKLAEKYGL